MPPELPEAKTPLRETFLRTIAVIGLVAVLLLGAWGIIQLAVALPTLLGSLGSGASSLFSGHAQESVTVSIPQSVQSGQSLKVDWTHQNQSGEYAYTVTYACVNGLSIKAPLPNGSYQTIACNTPFNFVNATEHMIVIPSVSGISSAPLALTVSATQLSTGVITASGSATTTVTSGSAATAPAYPTAAPAPSPAPTTAPAPQPTTSYYPAPTRPALYGTPDLAVQIISIAPVGAQTQVRFSIANVGTNVAQSGWIFNAQLPISGGYTYTSHAQQALYPGDKIVYTLAFSGGNLPLQTGYPYYGYSGQYPNPYNYPASSYPASGYTCNMYGPCTVPGYANLYPYGSPYQYPRGYTYGASYGGTVTITVDPYRNIPDTNRANNIATVPVAGY